MSAFTDLVDPHAFKIQNPPDYVFLCGGRLDDVDHSLRARFYEHKVKPNLALTNKIFIAELADEWYGSQKIFDDLLELEEHLAGLAACILVFVESPGAIAEFGAFSQAKLFREKLVVVIEDSHFLQQSFIRNGLIENFKRMKQESVLSYPWLSTTTKNCQRLIDNADASLALDEVEREVSAILSKGRKSASFQADDHGHKMLLIADLVALNVIIKKQELHSLLEDLGQGMSRNQFEKYLFLLEKLLLIRHFHFGHNDFYINFENAIEYISYAPQKPADRMKLRQIIRGDLPYTEQKKSVLAAFRKRMSGGSQ